MVPHERVLQTELCGVLEKDNAHRIERVLRLRKGDKFVITDGMGHEAVAELGAASSYSAKEWQTPNREPNIKTTVYAAVSKRERFEWLVEKAVEMGVSQIVPIIASRCVAKEPNEAKLERWQKIAVTAMLQCGGCVLPQVLKPVKIKDIKKPNDKTLAILLHEEALSNSLYELPDTGDKTELQLASGPEGGFDEAEVKAFIDKGFCPVWLGKRLFKTDTAPTVALASLLLKRWY